MRRAFLACVSFVSLVTVVQVPVAEAQLYESVGIRAQGLGGAFVAVADDATATYWNPAGIAGGPYFDLLAEYGRPDLAPNKGPWALAMAVPSLGLSYYRLPVSQMRPPASTGAGVSDRQEEGYLSQFGATFGQSIGPVVVASTVKGLNALGETHVDLDVGAMLTIHRVKAGLSLRNLHETTFGTAADQLSLQRVARAGLSVSGTPGGVVLTVAGDADLMSVTTAVGDERHVAGGAEAWLFNRVLGIRGGVSAETVHNTASRSGGVSLMLLSGQYLKTYVDGQLTGGSDPMRRGWGADVRLTF